MSRTKDILTDVIENLDIACDITEQEETELLEKLAPLGSVSIKEKIREVMSEMNIGVLARTNTSFKGKSVNAILARTGNTVYFTSPNDITSATAGSQVVGTLPEGYRPVETSVTRCANSADGTTYRALWVNNSGIMTMYTPSAISTATNCAFSASWVTNDPFPVNDIVR